MSAQQQDSQCCPKFDPAPWDDQIHSWENKQFIKDRVFTLFYMPVNFGAVMRRIIKRVDDADASIQGGLVLADHTSKWGMDIYVAVDKDVPDAENTTLTGKYFSKVYEGDFRQTKEWCKDFESCTNDKDLQIDKWYMWYTTCPKCAKKYGKNYVAIIGRVE